MATKINKLKKIYVVNEAGDGSKEFVEIYDSNEQIQSAVEAAKEAVKNSSGNRAADTPQIGRPDIPFIEATELSTTINFDNIDTEKAIHALTHENFGIKTYLSGGSHITVLMTVNDIEDGSTTDILLKDPLTPLATIDIEPLATIGRNIRFLTPMFPLNNTGSYSIFLVVEGEHINLYLNTFYGTYNTFDKFKKYVNEDDSNKNNARNGYLINTQVLQGLFVLEDSL
jgi:hypothetical protein|nr:MAG TPA: hypothetical protein [Caudoviricetes sp.]